jgi:hypothetical protein
MITNSTYNRHTSKPPVGIELAVPSSKNTHTAPDTANSPTSAIIYLKGEYPAV